MKKCLALMFVCAFVGSVASAQWLAYNYKASIKRLDNQITTVKYSTDVYDQTKNASIIFDSYTTAIDTLSGYLLVSICEGCSEGGSAGSLPFDAAFLYLTRKADKTDAIWKFAPAVNGGLFQKGVTLRPEDDALAAFPTSLEKLTQAWMSVEFAFEDFDLTADHGTFGDLPYGFLGFGSAAGEILSTGFGKAKLLDETTVSFCNPSTEISCFVITSITEGRMVGFVTQKGVCTEVPMWDVCALTLINAGVMHGTWSVKLNETLSTSVNNQSDFSAVETLLINKLGGGELIGEAAD